MGKYGYHEGNNQGVENKLYLAIIVVLLVSAAFLLFNNRRLGRDLERTNQAAEDYRTDLGQMETEYSELEDSYEEALRENKDLQKENQELKQKFDNSTRLYKPTPEELVSTADATGIHENEWTDAYDCIQFSFDLFEEFRDEGIFSCPVLLYFEERKVGHMLLKAETTEGEVFIEPQENTVLEEIGVGDDYCELLDWDCSWTISEIYTCEL
ncbi:MAG: hypothetical protein ACLFQ8_01570 [Candidatus Aenigmatarchaeota archaeon]